MNDMIKSPPNYCEYVTGQCDQSFDEFEQTMGLFLYPSEPSQIAATIEKAAELLADNGDQKWITWKDLKISGQVIFCGICKAMRFSDLIIADVTTLNFNLLFEIGFLLGLELPFIPIRDTSFQIDKAFFDEFGTLDTIGYTDFQNSRQLTNSIKNKAGVSPLPSPATNINFDTPLYVVKGPLETEGEIVLFSELKKSVLNFRTFDILETPRMTLHNVRKQVASSLGVIAHLLHPDRRSATVHNARCALISGIAMATGKTVLMLQEGKVHQPIDYREIIKDYSNPNQIIKLLEPAIIHIAMRLQDSRLRKINIPKKLLEKLEIGDVAAENEIFSLDSYFVQTGQYNQAKQGFARLVIGRKGSGKTAIFYAVRNSLGKGKSKVILDLKPEGHQFTKLRETILSNLSPGFQEHTLAAFWNSILLAEIAHKVVDEDYSWAQRHPERQKKFKELTEIYETIGYAERGDFSERLLNQVDRIIEIYNNNADSIKDGFTTELLYRGDIAKLNAAVSEYLEEKSEVWILVDNLDKGWPVQGASTEDILIIRTLLEATRKLQRQFEGHGVNFHCLVFLRNDIYDHLVRETPDKGKDTAILLEWPDPDFFKEIFRRRTIASGLIEGDFKDVWGSIFDPVIRTRDSFDYIIERTLMRPRDFLNFILRSIETAINRGHNTVYSEDILKAEETYSEDILKSISFELKDVYPSVPDFIYSFIGANKTLKKQTALSLLEDSGIKDDDKEDLLNLLCWYGFFGVKGVGQEDTIYSFNVRYDMNRLMYPVRKNIGDLVIHPAFRHALGCE